MLSQYIKNSIPNAMNSFLNRELRGREIKELFFKSVNLSVDEKETMKKRPFAKSTWYNRLINYLSLLGCKNQNARLAKCFINIKTLSRCFQQDITTT